VLGSVLYDPCLWELYYCASLTMSWVVCVSVLKVCDVRVGVLPVVMWVQVYYQNEKDSPHIPLVAGGRLLQAEQ